MPQMYWIIPVEGGHPDNSLPGGQGGRPDNSLPGGQGGRPDQGLPPFPSQGLPGRPGGRPDQGLPGSQPHPDQGLPGGQGGRPSHPIHIPGVPDQGLPPGENIPSNELPPIPVPPAYQEDLVIGVKQPNSTEWTFTAYDVNARPGQGLPPHPQPHG